MEAKLFVNIICPCCGNILAVDIWPGVKVHNVYYCNNSRCRKFQKKFKVKLPTIEIEEVRR